MISRKAISCYKIKFQANNTMPKTKTVSKCWSKTANGF